MAASHANVLFTFVRTDLHHFRTGSLASRSFNRAQVRASLAFSHRHSSVPKENAMPAKLSDDVIRLIDGRNFAHLATLLADGAQRARLDRA